MGVTIVCSGPFRTRCQTHVAKTETKVKQLCDWSKKDLRERFEELRELVVEPRYACTKCGRAACEKQWLCKPKAL